MSDFVYEHSSSPFLYANVAKVSISIFLFSKCGLEYKMKRDEKQV